MSLTKTLNLLGRRVMNDHPKLNYGGCCVYSAILGEELEKKGYHVVGKVRKPWFEDANPNIDEIRTKNNNKPLNINDWDKNGITFDHVFLEIYGDTGTIIHHDSEQTKKQSTTFNGREFYHGSMLVSHMKALALSPEGWNSMFNRNEIPKLTKTIVEFMSVHTRPIKKESSWLSCLLGL